MSYRLGSLGEGIKLFWQPIRLGFDTRGSTRRLCLVSIKSTLILYLAVVGKCTLYTCVSPRQLREMENEREWKSERESEALSEICQVFCLCFSLNQRIYRLTISKGLIKISPCLMLFSDANTCTHVMDFDKAIKSTDGLQEPCCFPRMTHLQFSFIQTHNTRWKHKHTSE